MNGEGEDEPEAFFFPPAEQWDVCTDQSQVRKIKEGEADDSSGVVKNRNAGETESEVINN